jgi:hypothetical protein
MYSFLSGKSETYVLHSSQHGSVESRASTEGLTLRGNLVICIAQEFLQYIVVYM